MPDIRSSPYRLRASWRWTMVATQPARGWRERSRTTTFMWRQIEGTSMRSLHRGGHVMKQLKIFGLVVTVMLASLGLTAGQQSPEPVVSVIRFSRVTRVPAAGEATTAMRLEVKDWALEKSPKGLQIPAQGFYIAQLRSGRAITTIGGKSRKRLAG